MINLDRHITYISIYICEERKARQAGNAVTAGVIVKKKVARRKSIMAKKSSNTTTTSNAANNGKEEIEASRAKTDEDMA